MPRFLLVKTSSLGDLVHNLPVVSDIRSHYADAVIDWVAEESFAAIPRLHAGVHEVIAVALRRWRRAWLSAQTRSECRAFIARLRVHEYDAIIDTQGLFKSALIVRAARGRRHGLDWKSSREPLRWFYDRTYSVPWGQHAVARNRSLGAQVLGYTVTTPAHYGISAAPREFSWLPVHQSRYAVLLHATSAEAKLWSEPNWLELHKYLILNNFFCVLPWGNAAERTRSERLAAAMGNAVVPPALALDDMAAVLAQAQLVIGLDTGLTHLAAALNVPTLGLYCATDPVATGIHGGARAANLGGIGAPPAVIEVVATVERLLAS